MSNPAPTINQINAFNATQGTTIDFNIIGGTELVRSNRIYIYDLSDNSLICTHLYVSTESIHELPTNTDSSIIYESGKSSADFINGAQYYAQIQTYTNTAGTEGGSGLSVAKMFWCLNNPTLTIGTIPSTISTTSYNVSATYDANTSVVSNIIQQYQFSLYSATGSLLQSSGVIVGSGEQQGTSTAYDISYNFTGLSVGSSYYVTVEVTTTQGMSVSAQSNTFTVSVDTPTVGGAIVNNNACDGYISVVSNLSDEYGGHVSGEMASFETDSVNNVSSLKVNMEPLQDLNGYDKPWVGGAGKNKFDVDAWIALPRQINWYSVVDGVVSVNANDGSSITGRTLQFKPNTQYTISFTNPSSCRVFDEYGNTIAQTTSLTSVSFTTTDSGQIAIKFYGSTYPTVIGKVQIEEGSTATAWTPYSNICPISGHDSVSAHITDEQKYDFSNVIIGKNWIGGTDATRATLTFDVEPSTRYRVITEGGNFSMILFIRMEGYTQITNIGIKPPFNGYITTESNCNKVVVQFQKDTAITADDFSDFKCSISKEYESYTTTLPSTTYGGTLDLVTGVLTVDRASVDLGTLTPYQKESGVFGLHISCPTSGAILCSAYPVGIGSGGSLNPSNIEDKTIITTNFVGTYYPVFVKDTDYTSAADFKTAMNGVQLVYELAEPQTYQLTPHQIQTLVGQNNVWSDAGDVEVTFNLPISNLLVKRQDASDVSGDWLTLYSQPITQASDMDFTFIDFLNQNGKTYRYALVPLLTQTQSGVIVEIEGGYTVSDNVNSIFDGVYIADQTNVERVKAGAGYGNIDMNQGVGSITPIGSKYPVVITNSQNQYHNGSIRGTIVPNDFYSNGNLSRIDMVNKRDELEQFLTNKRAKIIKDWNGKMWLVMIMSNVSCSFDDNYGMGMVSFNADWVEVGDPTNQQDLYNAGLINVGGV